MQPLQTLKGVDYKVISQKVILLVGSVPYVSPVTWVLNVTPTTGKKL